MRVIDTLTQRLGGAVLTAVTATSLLESSVVLAHPTCEKCGSIIINSIQPSFSRSQPSLLWPDQIDLILNVRFSFSCTCEQPPCANPPPPRLRLVLQALDGTSMAERIWDAEITSGACNGFQDTTLMANFSFNPCALVPRSYYLQFFQPCSVGDTMHADPACQITGNEWVPSEPATIVLPTTPEPVCDGDAVAPNCDSTAGYPELDVVYYKFPGTSPTLFTTSTSNEPRSLYGEAVNAEFKAPNDGYLFVSVTGPNGAVSVRGSAVADGPGWQLPGGRQGVDPDGRCIPISAGQRYKFNLWSGRSDAPGTFQMTFDFFWWHDLEWGVVHQRKTLDVGVGPLPCNDNTSPQTLRVLQRYKSDGSPDTLIKLLCCGKGGGLTDWFVAWPTSNGAVIPEGHAKGMIISGNEIHQPERELNKLKYIGETVP